MFTNATSSEEHTALSSLMDSFTNEKPVHDETNNKSTNLSLITTESPFHSAELLEQSWWNVFDQRYFRHSTEWTIILIAAYMSIFVIGVIGNSMVILVVILRPQMRSVTNIFITNLAVADLFVIVFCAPATLLANIFQPWILGSFMCKGVAYIQGVSVCASAYSLAAVSFDRCQAIYSPLVRQQGLSKTQTLATICLIWMIALLLTVPWAVIFNVIESDKNGMSYCIETWENEYHGKIYFLVANLLCCYFLPLVLISISNAVIWCHVAHRKVPQDSASVGPIKRMHKRARHGVLKMLGIVTLIFLLSWLPLYILVTRQTFWDNLSETELNVMEILMPFAQWLGSWNSSINPILYAFLNKKYRDMFRSILPRWIPFVHRKYALNRMTTVSYGGRMSNGSYVGSFGASCYSSIYIARGSERSRCQSRQSTTRHQYRHQRNRNNGASNNMVVFVSNCHGCTASEIVTEL